MEYRIIELAPADFSRCGEIWDLNRQPALAAQFRAALAAGERRTWLCEAKEQYIAEISLVFDMRDAHYTLPGQRAYVSHLVVRPEYRRQGLGQALLRHVREVARALGYDLQALFVALNDQVFEIRELAICTVGRLSSMNPAFVMPFLRKMLIQVRV